MAIPASWAKKSERLRYTTERGWEIVQVWEGPSGAAKATRGLWLAEQSGYTSLDFEDTLPMDDGDAVCRATITFASNSDGDTVLPGGAEYGLLSRSWTLLGSDEQLPIEALENVTALQEFSEDWPASIRGTVNGFQKANTAILESFPWGTPASPALEEWDEAFVKKSGASAALNGYAVDYASLLLLSDNPTFDRAKYVLRKTETVTSWSTMVVSHTNVNRWWRWATLTAAEPTLASTGLLQTAGLTGYIWLKKAPEVTLASNGTRELTQEFWGGVLPATGTTARRQLEFIFGAVV